MFCSQSELNLVIQVISMQLTLYPFQNNFIFFFWKAILQAQIDVVGSKEYKSVH